MKISKCKHVRMAVFKTEHNQEVGGVLYRYPTKDKSGKEIKGVKALVDKRCDDANRLYSIFKSKAAQNKCIGIKKYEIIRKLVRNINRSIVELCKICDRPLKDELLCELEKKIADEINRPGTWIQPLYIDLGEEHIKKCIELICKSRLRECYKKKGCDNLVKIFLANCCKSACMKDIVITSEDIHTFSEILYKDYYKREETQSIVKSINNQNVKIQPVQCDDGRILLQPPGYDNGKGKNKYVFELMLEYAKETEGKNADENKALIYFNGILKLYFGAEKYLDMEVYNLIATKEQNGRKISQDVSKIKRIMSEAIYNRYRILTGGDNVVSDKDNFWLLFIADRLHNKIKRITYFQEYSVSNEYLMNSIYKEWKTYMCEKYIDMGKAVYHFAMPDLYNLEENIRIGEVEKRYTDGITSFDYEYIKADEDFDREISSYVAVAVHNMEMAVKDGEKAGKNSEDILNLDKNSNLYKMRTHSDIKRRILQFWGGQSTWESFEAEYPIKSEELFDEIVGLLSVIRNGSFHHTGKMEKHAISVSKTLLARMYEAEYIRLEDVQLKRWYTSNVWKFYPLGNAERELDEDKQINSIYALMRKLYKAQRNINANMPAFNKVIKKADISDMLYQSESEELTKCLYFILKEIYYYDFLECEDLLNVFYRYVEKRLRDEKENSEKKALELNKPNRGTDEEKATRSFFDRVKEIKESNKNITFVTLCQQIATDYQLQQSDTSELNSDGKNLYSNYKFLLYVCTKEVFKQYIEEKYNFLLKPELQVGANSKKVKWEEFKVAKLYIDPENIGLDKDILSWYAMAHFIDSTQMNHLMGALAGYVQYVSDIARREKKLVGRSTIDVNEKCAYYKNIISVLNLVQLTTGNISERFCDYFVGDEAKCAEDKYKEYVSNFYDFDYATGDNESEENIFEGLLYISGKPLLNRNVIFAKLFGDTRVLNNISKITENEKQHYAKFKNKYIEKQDEPEEQLIIELKMQRIKNRLELVNIKQYMSVVNDMFNQMISWAYLRERDMMYFQLGIQYIKLYWCEDLIETDDIRRKLKLTDKNVSIEDGAVLYQIVAMNTHDLPCYSKDRKGNYIQSTGSAGAGVRSFVNMYGAKIYYDGMRLFEDIYEYNDENHDKMVEHRNYICHFKYYEHLDQSIMDLYSTVFDRFFSYSQKLHKSVPVVFKNILAKYGLLAKTTIVSEDDEYGNKHSKICFREKDGLYAKEYTYPVYRKGNSEVRHKGKEMIIQPARDNMFVRDIKRILEYKAVEKSM